MIIGLKQILPFINNRNRVNKRKEGITSSFIKIVDFFGKLRTKIKTRQTVNTVSNKRIGSPIPIREKSFKYNFSAFKGRFIISTAPNIFGNNIGCKTSKP